MPADFHTLRNYYERQVIECVTDHAPNYPMLTDEQHPDVACVALNRLPPRYIRHEVDLAFYLTEKERTENERVVDEAVRYAFEFVQARFAMRARRWVRNQTHARSITAPGCAPEVDCARNSARCP